MILLLAAVVLGLLAGSLRAAWSGGALSAPELRSLWLVPVAFVPQGLAFFVPGVREVVPDRLAAVVLVLSQALLLAFVWVNVDRPGFWILGLGLGMNLLVILINGGLMPISPETVARLSPGAPPGAWQVGTRLGWTKDVVLPVADTRLWWLADRFLIPEWSPYRAAFSLGDVLIAIGAFWSLWEMGRPGFVLREAIER